ncbi:MAG TPA: SpoIIE family protein phosphatase [Xanthobacteraceae bacterium]|nr:SpoIIE family protein phosphatase [Xanthobacteraceae bacterium]
MDQVETNARTAANKTGPRILVVDDNDDNRYTLTLYLELEGYSDVVVAHDGEQAIERLKADAFDLVLLDVMMPKVDGYQVLAWAAKQPQLSDLPIIMISALNEIDSVVRCVELGAVDYLLKPFNPVLLKARLGATLEKKRLRDEVKAHLARLRAELDAARKLQLAMVPQAFPPPSADFPVDLFAMMEPAREVGGDLYDFFPTADGRLCFLIGDVSGKGMPAALFMARTKSLIRIATELMRGPDGGPPGAADIIGRVNRELSQSNPDMMFVTMFFALLAPKTGEIEFCNAGHNAPYRLKGGEVAPIEAARGVILGVRPNAAHVAGRLTLTPDETIYLFTDGVTEAINAAAELFSEERLEAVLRAANGKTSAALVDAVASELRVFVGAAEAFDDITMLALRPTDVTAG